MAYLLSGERPAAAAVPVNPFRVVFGWLATLRARHHQRIALSHLLDFEEAMLEDMGISRQDVLEALRYPSSSPGRLLSARRAATSRDWLSHP